MKIPTDILNRKGPRKIADITEEVLALLNQGLIESKNLSEWLAIDNVELLNHTFSQSHPQWVTEISEEIKSLKKPSTLKIAKIAGSRLQSLAKKKDQEKVILEYLQAHTSDMVRCWACYFIAAQDLALAQKLAAIKPLAADQNAGTREIAFIALKPAIVAELEKAIDLLLPFIEEEDENLRRYAIEITRPIGVWCVSIPMLKEKPAIAISLLSPLKADPSRYVQNAVANWLNDASKSQPDWVESVCEDWKEASNTKSTQYIVKRAMRTINK